MGGGEGERAARTGAPAAAAAVRVRRRARRQAHRSPALQAEYVKACVAAKEVIKEAKRDHWHEYVA
eukprot:gene2113-5917_t